MNFLFSHFKKVLLVLIFLATINSVYANTLNLQDTTIHGLIEVVSKITGKTFVVDPRVNPAKVTVMMNKKMGDDELYDIFLSILDVHGNSVIKTGNIIKIIPKNKALAETHPLVDLPKSEPAEKLITRLIPIKNVTSLSIANSLRALARNVKIQHHVESNSVLLSGRVSDLERVNRLIQRMDRSNEKHIEVIPLKFADAESLVKTIQDLNRSSKGAVGKFVGRGDKISADRRTNSLLVSGDTATRQRIRAIVRRLDIPKKQEGRTKVVYLRYAKATELVTVLQGLSKTSVIANKNGKAKSAGESSGTSSVDIQADESTNSLIITAEPAVYKNLYTVIQKLDVRRAQVMIETIIAEVGTTLSATLGMQFGFNGLNGKAGPIGVSSFAGAGGNNLGSIISSKGASLGTGALLGVGATFGGTQFVALLDALSSDGATNILSTPTLVTMDNEKAEIVVGQNIPLITGSFSGTGSGGSTPSNPFQTIQRQDVGLTLRVTPQINEGTTVRLAIEQEISSLAASNAGAADLITNKRSVNTNVMVEDNDVLVLGGLFENTFRDSQEKVPVLSNIPFLGRLFRHDTTTKDHQNLMIFIHPIILRDNLTASKYSRMKYSKIQRRQESSKILRRGALEHRADRFPNMDRMITKKPTSAELARERQQQQQQQREQRQRQQQHLARQRAAQQRQHQHQNQHRAPAPKPQQPYRAPSSQQGVDKEYDAIPFIDDY